MHEMSDENMEKMKKMMMDMGISEEMITDELAMAMKKTMMGGMMIHKELVKQGMTDDKAMELQMKWGEKMMDPKLMKESGEMMEGMVEDWKDKKDKSDWKDKDDCNTC